MDREMFNMRREKLFCEIECVVLPKFVENTLKFIKWRKKYDNMDLKRQ